MSVCRYLVALASLGLAVAVPPAEAWLRRFGGAVQVVRNVAVATAVDSRGDVVTITHTSSDLGVCRATARKRAGRTGRLLWERALGTCSHPASVVEIDASDDVVVGLSGFVVAKLDGRRGEVVWDTALEEGAPWESGVVSALAIDPGGRRRRRRHRHPESAR